MKRIIYALILVCLMASVSYAQSYLNISADKSDSFNAVLVEKSAKKLHVLRIADGTATELLSFPVLTGRVDGDKTVQGDERTPEGLYFVTGFLSPAKLRDMYGDIARQYGTGAYPLSYPNLKDRLDGKTGGGIWLHGVDPERAEDVTKGCVAFENHNVDKMAEYITEGTPVVITDKAMDGDADALLKHFTDARKLVQDYVQAWESNDFDSFKSFYHAGFKSVGGRNFGSYLGFKKYLMDTFPYRKVFAGGFRVFSQSVDEAVVEFDQFYCAPNVISSGRKRFYYERELDGLKLVAEEFRPSDSTAFIRERVNELLISWKNAWESLQVDDYMAFYSDSFQTRGMDRAAWKADKAEKFAALQDVQVGIENISYSATSPVSYEIEFLQRYKGDAYSDVGVKTLKVEGCPGDFKITAEYWRAK